MVQALVLIAAEKTSKTPFYIAGSVLAAFAIVLSAIGITRHETFPPSAGAARAIAAVCLVLVVAAMAAAVLTA